MKPSSKAVTRLRDLITKLKDDAAFALSATNGIIDAHGTFTRHVADDFRRAIDTGILAYDPAVQSLAQKIGDRSGEVFLRIEDMRSTLEDLVVTLDRAYRKRKKNSWKQRMWKWLKGALNVLAGVLGGAAALDTTGYGVQSHDARTAIALLGPVLRAIASVINSAGEKGKCSLMIQP